MHFLGPWQEAVIKDLLDAVGASGWECFQIQARFATCRKARLGVGARDKGGYLWAQAWIVSEQIGKFGALELNRRFPTG